MSLAIVVALLTLQAPPTPQELAPPAPPGSVRWGEELPRLDELYRMDADALWRALDDATKLKVTASHRTAAQVLVLRALAGKDPVVGALFSPFPVAVVVTPSDGAAVAVADRFAAEAVRLLNELELPAVLGEAAPHKGTLRIAFDVMQNDTSRSLMAGSKMQSYAVRIGGRFVGEDGKKVFEFGAVHSALGISVESAAAADFDRNAASNLSEFVDRLARTAVKKHTEAP